MSEYPVLHNNSPDHGIKNSFTDYFPTEVLGHFKQYSKNSMIYGVMFQDNNKIRCLHIKWSDPGGSGVEQSS